MQARNGQIRRDYVTRRSRKKVRADIPQEWDWETLFLPLILKDGSPHVEKSLDTGKSVDIIEGERASDRHRPHSETASSLFRPRRLAENCERRGFFVPPGSTAIARTNRRQPIWRPLEMPDHSVFLSRALDRVAFRRDASAPAIETQHDPKYCRILVPQAATLLISTEAAKEVDQTTAGGSWAAPNRRANRRFALRRNR